MNNMCDFDISDRYGKNCKLKKLRNISVISPSVSTTGKGNVTGIVYCDSDRTTPIKSAFAKDNVSVCAKCEFGHKKQNKSVFDDNIFNFCSSEDCSTSECFVVSTDVKITELNRNGQFTYDDVHNEGDLLDTKKSSGPILNNPDEKEQQTSDFIQKKIESNLCPVNDDIFDLCDSETSTSSNKCGAKLGIITEYGGDRSMYRNKVVSTAGYPVYREKILSSARKRKLDITNFLDDEAVCYDDSSIGSLVEFESQSHSEYESDGLSSPKYYKFVGKYKRRRASVKQKHH